MDKYNYEYNVEYTNDDEYREHLQNVFMMNLSDFETETDEVLYDNDTMNQGLDYIFKSTKESALFKELYSQLSAQMLSENLEIGLVILFSYDYFNLFHKLLQLYLQKPDEFCMRPDNESTLIYNELLNKIKR
jgi:hypothetical protein